MNQNLFILIHNLSGRFFGLDELGIFLASYYTYVLVIIALALPLAYKSWRTSLLFYCEIFLAGILSRGIFTEIIRFFYNHPRPFAVLNFTPLIPESGNSFPSGHTAFLFAIALIIYFWKPKWGWFFFISGLLVGLARIYVGVHWPFDILGGIVIGLLSGFIIYYLLLEQKNKLLNK
jgi:undecaprenyl-diphosphatase